ncbi:Xin actin-binding repeat-containing protein 2 [Triplophysa tibetana]|uniref:Xin actin-binding repeat-containing protein 2 n=1 Tax=Triplophysa tibetana TaxID=1572043 RepID=A0A5A9P3V0_9TELE|nr:Xin actin-binding repeat-containing protein 2 [Triplophysa tibetana]
MEEAEVCSPPGGLASVRRQFEKEDVSTAHTLAQFHLSHRSVQPLSPVMQEVSHSSAMSTVSNGGGRQVSQQVVLQDERIERNINRLKPGTTTSIATYTPEGNEPSPIPPVVDDEDDEDDLDYLPPPPPELLEETSEILSFPEPPKQEPKHLVNKEQYFRQREYLELKRLCKHIHPEVRKDLERDFYQDIDETEDAIKAAGEVQDTSYQFDHAGSISNGSPDREYLEWDEMILRGEVQSMRWMFENKPLDCIKDDSSDNEMENKNDTEIPALGDVRNTALMFETQPMDALGIERDTAKRNYLVNEVGKRDVRAAAWLFETKPMDTLNKIHTDEEQTKEVIFTQEASDRDVKSVRYMFENQEMDPLGDTETMDEKQLLSLKSVREEIKLDVKKIIWLFETQCMCVMRENSGAMVLITSVRREETEKGDVKTSRWLFETQPLENIYRDLSQVRLISSISMEDNKLCEVKVGRWLFETKRLDSINAQWERLQKQQTEEIVRADVRRHCMVFETQPMDKLKDDSNSRPVTSEEIIGGNVRSVRHLFESAPADELKDLPEVGKLIKRVAFEEERGDLRHQKWGFENTHLENIEDEEEETSRRKKTLMSDEERADIRHQRWLFENQRLEEFREEKREFIKTIESEQIDRSYRGDVRRNCLAFETRSMDTLKDDSNARPLTSEEIIGGDVQSARQYFETAPKDEDERARRERGDVRHQKWVFESQLLDQIGEEKREMTRTVNIEDIENVDVTNYTEIFETCDLSQYDESQKIQVEGVTAGSVRSNKHLFESMPLYALQDSSGHYHEVRTVRREEIVKGDVRSCQWMFETRPIDQFDESISKFQIIKGITQQEVESGDVKTAKWLFETQPLDAIKYFSNIEDEENITRETTEIVKGDVQTCKWLFETKPMDTLYEKEEFKSENDASEVEKGDVKTCTWLFENQTLDNIRQESSETVLQTRTVRKEDIHGKDVNMARVLFETEKLENIIGEDGEAFKRVTEIDIRSGDVSRMKYIFETQSSDAMSSTSEDLMRRLRTAQAEDIQRGNVDNCKWLFENQPMDAISETPDELKGTRTVQDIQGGNVHKGRFIFETCSLDTIQDEAEMRKIKKVVREDEEKGDVQTYAMMFETQPLYAIRDKEGHYHEVTTLTKEEIQKGDVFGTRWLFETKPLDSIRETDEVYLLKAVTEEDIQKGDVSSARWRFETQPLDKIAEDGKISIKTVENIQGGDVKTNKERFESDVVSEKLVRTVSMSEIHKGDVRTAKWMFETHTIDQIHNEKSEDEMKTVVMEEQLKGDVKQSVWLFEKNPLDHINEGDESKQVLREEIPKADVISTRWLFETTPITEFNQSSLEKTEILGKSVKATLDELYTQRMVDSKGIIIEADEIGDVRMAKYNLMNKEAPQIQKEDIVKADLQNIMMNLLNRQESIERGVIINLEERGDISSTVHQLLHQHSGSTPEKEEIIRGDIEEAMKNLLKEESTGKRGILIQEDEKGDIRMTIYSLFNTEGNSSAEREDIVKGNVKGCLEKLYNPDTEEIARIKVDEEERGNVRMFSTCIESGALDYLKHLQVGTDDLAEIEKEEIIGGDIKGMKLNLTYNRAQIGRLVDSEDIVPGDVHNTVKVFMTEPLVSFDHLQKDEIVKGDLQATLNSLTQSINQTVILEKEEVIKGDIHTTLRSLEEAQNQPKEVEKPEIIPGNIKGALKLLKDSASTKVETVVEDFVAGDIKGTLKSLREAKHVVREVEREEIVKGDVHNAIKDLQEASSERKVSQQEIDVQGDVKGKIQLLLDAPSSPRMQRRASTEGDVKLSIKSLYETQEQVQAEKEEVIKGDVKGTIKSLMETAQRASPTAPRRQPIRKVKGPVKSQPPSEITTQKHTPTVKKQKNMKSMQSRCTILESEMVTRSQESTVMEHKKIVQTHGVKTLKTDFRNLNSSCKGLIRLDKTKARKNEIPPSEPEPPLPPPPSPLPDYDSMFFPAPPPPVYDPAKSDFELFPPPPTPPPPAVSEQDPLPPPPTEQELDLLPVPSITPAKPTKMTVKPVKAPTLCKVPKLEPVISFDRMDMQAVKVKNVSKTTTTSVKSYSEIQSAFTKQPPESPRPPKKVFAPLTLTPPASPPPSKSSVSKFKTPLIQAEQKFRQTCEESCTPPRSPAFQIHMHESVTAALEMHSSENTSTVKSKTGVSFDFIQETAVTKCESSAESRDSSTPALADAPLSKALMASTNEKSPPESPLISSGQANVISSGQTTSASSKKKKKRSTTTNVQQVTSVTHTSTVINNASQASGEVMADKPQSVSENVSAEIEHAGVNQTKEKDKTSKESPPNKSQGKNSPDRSKAKKESQIKDAEQKVQKADGQKGKKVSKSAKEKTTAEQTQSVKVMHDNVQVTQSNEKSPAETRRKAEKEKTDEPPVTPKKKRRSKNKKDKEAAQQSITSATSVTESKLTLDKKQEEITQRSSYTEVIRTERSVKQHEEVTMNLLKETCEDQQIEKEPAESLRQDEARKMVSLIIDLQRGAGKIDFKSVKTLLNEMPTWLLGPEEKSELEGAALEHDEQKLEELLARVENLLLMYSDGGYSHIEKHEREATVETILSGGATQRISKITIGSTKCEKSEQTKSQTRKSRKQQTVTKPPDPSPPLSLLMRSPSPTFITIESTKRTDSPQRAATPPTPPPRRSETPLLNRSSPSASSSRAHSLTRLRNATATLSRGASPDPAPCVVQVCGKKAEIVESPATFHRQIKIDSKHGDEKNVTEGSFEKELTSLVSEELEKCKMEGNMKLGDIPQHLSSNTEQSEENENIPELDSKVEISAEKVIQIDLVDKTEKPGSEDLMEKTSRREDAPAFNIKDIKNVFETGEQSSPIKAPQNKQGERDSRVIEIALESSKPALPREREQRSQRSSSHAPVDPTGFSVTKTEHYSSVEQFSTKIIESRSSSTHGESVTTQRVPFSYADAVRKTTTEVTASPEASAEELMKSFHKTWTESESVFKSLGVTGNFQEGFGQVSQREFMATRNARNAERGASDWRYLLSQSSVCLPTDTFENAANKQDEKVCQNPNKIAVVWPPQSASSENARDGKFAKPIWPPKSETSKNKRELHMCKNASRFETFLHESQGGNVEFSAFPPRRLAPRPTKSALIGRPSCRVRSSTIRFRGAEDSGSFSRTHSEQQQRNSGGWRRQHRFSPGRLAADKKGVKRGRAVMISPLKVPNDLQIKQVAVVVSLIGMILLTPLLG